MTPTELADLIESQAGSAEAMGATAPVAQVLRTLIPKIHELTLEANGNGNRPDRMISAKDGAERIGMSVRWLYQHASELSFVKKYPSGAVKCSTKGIDRWLSRQT